MPAPKEAGLNTVGFLRVMIIGISLLFYIAWSSRGNIPPPPNPTSLPLSTSTPFGTSAGTPIPMVGVLITTVNNNQFDDFDISQVVIRISNSAQVYSGATNPIPIPFCPDDQSIHVWAPGYEIQSLPCDGRTTSYPITLTHLVATENENANYTWAFASLECNTCHGNQLVPYPQTNASYDEMNEWFRSGHAKIFKGHYFESMYQGISAQGKPSIPAQPVIIDNEWVPVPAEKSLLYHGPGFQLDYPGQPGNCAYCHVPTSVTASQQGVNLSRFFPQPEGSLGEGVTCDVCHKVFSVTLADDKLPFPDRPGILSYRFLRPNSGVLITGPFSNILTKFSNGTPVPTDHRSTCNPVFSQSEFCAPCHFGKFGDMVVYNSFGEWKSSPYAANPGDPGYRTCQDCHMSHLYKEPTTSSSLQRQACSANNTAFQNFDHNMMDFGTDSALNREIPRMVRGAARVNVTFGSQSIKTNTLNVNVTVTNTKAGHKFPTDSPLRHLILVVKAVDRVNTPLIQLGGDQIPSWGGPGPISKITIARNLIDPGIPDYSGMAGKAFANLLIEEETNLSPAMAYWNETKYASVDSVSGGTSDTRLVPNKPDLSTYSFAMPDAGDVKVTVQLFYRFAFYDLMVWKEWYDRPDILVAAVECKGPPMQPDILTKSCVQVSP